MRKRTPPAIPIMSAYGTGGGRGGEVGGATNSGKSITTRRHLKPFKTLPYNCSLLFSCT